jgi:hypothetical protein
MSEFFNKGRSIEDETVYKFLHGPFLEIKINGETETVTNYVGMVGVSKAFY